MEKRPNVSFIRIALLGGLLLLLLFFSRMLPDNVNEVQLDEFLSQLNQATITNVTAQPKEEVVTLTGRLKDEDRLISTTVLRETYTQLLAKDPSLTSKVVMKEPVPQESGSLLPLLSMIMSMALLAVMFLFLFRGAGQGGNRSAMNFGKSKARLISPDENTVTFKDVAGAEEEKFELMEVVDFLKDPGKYVRLGAKIPKGVLMVGLPGTGKTLLARAIAGEAGVPFFSISGSDFVEMFVGVGASRVRDMFETAKKNAPCILFLDEIDAVGRQRGTGFGGGHDEREQTLNQLLVEMDGFKENQGIVVVAATNRADVLDPALLRPGRFDRRIHIDLPDVRGREAILNVHTQKKPLGDDVNLEVIARTTTGFSGAELSNLTNEAALLAARRGRQFITMADFEEARTKVQLGPEKRSRVQTEETRRLTAYHEAGHAVVARSLPSSDPVTEISIIPRGGAGGYTMHIPLEDVSYISRTSLMDDLATLFGGRCAESLVLNDISTGAKSDIDRASKIARAMVKEYGMSDAIGTLSFSEGEEVFLGRDMARSQPYSDAMGNLIDQEVKKLVDEAYGQAEDILKQKIEILHLVAKTLLEKESLQAYEFEALYSQGELPPAMSEVEARQANEAVLKEHGERRRLALGEVK